MNLNLFLLFVIVIPLCLGIADPWIPKVVWTYWQNPIQQNDLLMLSFSKCHQQKLKGWEIRHLNKNNMWKWLDQIPGLKKLFYGKEFQSQVTAKRADLIRLAIMNHYGGVWMDYTMILMQSLDWLFQLKANPWVENKNGDRPDFFILYSSEHGDLDMAFDMDTNQKFLLYPTLEVFFMAARPGTQFAKDWIDYYIKVVKNTYKKYGKGSYNSWLVDYAQQHNYKRGGFQQGLQNYFQCSITASVLLQQKQKQLQYNQALYKKNTYKLAVKQYNIWIMGTEMTAYRIQNMVGFQSKPSINILAQQDIRYLRQINYFPKYFVKIYHQLLIDLKRYLYNFQTISNIPCPQLYYIGRNSILYKYLLENTGRFYLNQLQEYSYNRDCVINMGRNEKQMKREQQQYRRQLQIKKQKQLQIQRYKKIQNQLQHFIKQNQIQVKRRQELQQKQSKYRQEIRDLKTRVTQYKNQKEQLLGMIRFVYIGFITAIVSLIGIFCICARRSLNKTQVNYRQYPKTGRLPDDQPQNKKLYDK